MLTQRGSLEELVSQEDHLHVHLDIMGQMSSHIELTVSDNGISNKLIEFKDWERTTIDKLLKQAKTTHHQDAVALMQLTRRLGQKFAVDQ